MTLSELKDLLSTYGVNDEERNALVFVNINGVPTPIIAGEVEYGTYDEEARAWVDRDRPHVLLQTGDVELDNNNRYDFPDDDYRTDGSN